MVLPKKSCRCDAPGCFGYTMESSGARWLGRQSVKKVWPAARADGRTSTMSSAPRMMTSQGSALGLLPLSVRDPRQTGGPPYPPLLSAHPAVLLESEQLESEQRDHSQVLTGTESRRDRDGVGTSRTAIRSWGKPEHRADATGPVVGSETGRALSTSRTVHMPCTGCPHRHNPAPIVDRAYLQAGNDPRRALQ